jgi:hypothetical protein
MTISLSHSYEEPRAARKDSVAGVGATPMSATSRDDLMPGGLTCGKD